MADEGGRMIPPQVGLGGNRDVLFPGGNVATSQQNQYWQGPPLPQQTATGDKFKDATSNAFLYDMFANQYALGQNRPNYNDPYGGSTWNQSLGTDAYGNEVPVWEQNVHLNPVLQEALDAQQGLIRDRSVQGSSMFDRVANDLSDAPDWSQLQDWGNVPGRYELDTPQFDPYLDYRGAYDLGTEGDYRSTNFSDLGAFEDPNELRARVESDYYDKAASRLNPYWEQAQTELEAEMRGQGLRPGDAQWNERMGRFREAKTDAYGQAQYDSTMAGGSEFDRATGLDLARRRQLVGEQQSEVDSYNDSLLNLFGERSSRRGFDTRESDALWNAYNTTQQMQSQENRAVADQNYRQELSQSEYANTLREQQMTLELLQRGASLNEINALLSGQQVQLPGQPYGGQAGVAGGGDFQDAAYLNEQVSNLRRQNDLSEQLGWGGVAGQLAGTDAGQKYIDSILAWVQNRVNQSDNQKSGIDPADVANAAVGVAGVPPIFPGDGPRGY
jgi:hypothetical protein